MADRTLILASNSPRRRQLLELVGISFKVAPADLDERRLPGELPDVHVQRLAESKARAVAVRVVPSFSLASNTALSDWLILAADTIVVEGDDILGKPASPEDAARILRRLRGRTHQVFTAIVLLQSLDGKLVREICRTRVPMRFYQDDEIQAYIDSGDPMDKAGAYAIQHPAFHPVESLQGCYASVMGMPLCHLVRAMDRLGISALTDVPKACQAALNYSCPIYRAVLGGEDAG